MTVNMSAEAMDMDSDSNTQNSDQSQVLTTSAIADQVIMSRICSSHDPASENYTSKIPAENPSDYRSLETQSIGEPMQTDPPLDQAVDNKPQIIPAENRRPVQAALAETRRRREKQLEDELELAKKDRETMAQTYNKLKQEFEILLRNNKDLSKEKDDEAHEYLDLVKDKDDEIRRYKLQNEDQSRKYFELNQNYQSLLLKWSHRNTNGRLYALEVENRELIERSNTLDNECTHLRERCASVDRDNVALRGQITRMCSAQEPICEEDYYIRQFTQIDGDIESWAAIETRKRPASPLPEAAQVEIISGLQLLSNHELSTGSLKTELLMDYSVRRKRIALTRHVIALFLYNEILDRFNFNLARDSSDYLKWIEKEIYTQELDLAKILMVRQAIGRATMSRSNLEDLKTRRETLIQNLCSLLKELLPTSQVDRIRGFVEKIIDKAISLRNAMTQEQAIYRCYFPHTGDSFNEFTDQVANGEKNAGNVLICTFPGLHRFTIQKEGKREFIIVVRATVKLEGAFE